MDGSVWSENGIDFVKICDRLFASILIRVRIDNGSDFVICRRLGYVLSDILAEIVKFGYRDEMSRDTPLHQILSLETMSSQTKIESEIDVVLYTRKEIRAAHVSKEADTSLGHSIYCRLSRYSNGCVARYANSATHRYAVPESDLKRSHVGKLIILKIFVGEELLFY